MFYKNIAKDTINLLEAIYNSSCSAENENYYSIKNYQKQKTLYLFSEQPNLLDNGHK